MKKRMMAFLLCIGLLLPGSGCAGEDRLPELPSVYITTENGSNHFADAYCREHKLQGLIDYVEGSVSVSGGGWELPQTAAQLKVRGNYTLDYPKKSIRIKFAKKQSLLGLNSGRAYKSWVLLAEWKDLSMLNSPTALFLARQILGGDGYYCTDSCFVHLYINGDYRGLYLLAEQQEVNPGRVDVAEAADESLYTGYLLEYDAYYLEEELLPSSDPFIQVDHTGFWGEQYGYTVKSDLPTEEHAAFLQSCLQHIYTACCLSITENRHYAFNRERTRLVPAISASAKETVGRFIDLPSLVDTYILQEIVCNPDAGWSSFYLSLDLSETGSGKLTFQAPWDFDSAFGIRAGYESSEGLYVPGAGNPWLGLVASEPWFTELVRRRWAQLREDGLPEKTLNMVAQWTEAYRADFDRNYQRWPERIRDGNHELIEELNLCQSQQEAADYLYRWLSRRFAFLDAQWR